MVAQVVGNQKVKSIKKAKSFKKQTSKEESPKVDDLISDSSLETIAKLTKGVLPIAKRAEFAKKVLVELYKANQPQIIENVYSPYYKSTDKEFIRRVETKVNGYIDHNKGVALEKYNPELDIWEEYKEEEIKKESWQILSQVENNICNAMDLCEIGKLACNADDSAILVQMETLFKSILSHLDVALDGLEENR